MVLRALEFTFSLDAKTMHMHQKALCESDFDFTFFPQNEII